MSAIRANKFERGSTHATIKQLTYRIVTIQENLSEPPPRKIDKSYRTGATLSISCLDVEICSRSQKVVRRLNLVVLDDAKCDSKLFTANSNCVVGGAPGMTRAARMCFAGVTVKGSFQQMPWALTGLSLCMVHMCRCLVA